MSRNQKHGRGKEPGRRVVMTRSIDWADSLSGRHTDKGQVESGKMHHPGQMVLAGAAWFESPWAPSKHLHVRLTALPLLLTSCAALGKACPL